MSIHILNFIYLLIEVITKSTLYLDKTQLYDDMNDFSERISMHCGYVTSF